MEHADGAGTVDHWAVGHGFGPWLAVPPEGRLSSLTSRTTRRCGVYLLRHENGDVYLGKSVDVIGRLGQHRREREHLREVRFRWCSRAVLPTLERKLIHDAERAGLPLTNHAEMSTVRGDRPLDELVPPELQATWAADPLHVNRADTEPRATFPPEMLRRFQTSYQRFLQHPEAPGALAVLRSYVDGCLLLPRRTERELWSLSCLPSTTRGTPWARLACVSVGRMETLVVGSWGGFVVVAADELPEEARRRYRRGTQASDYADAGVHQVRIEAGSVNALAALVDDPDVAHAAAALTYRVMRKGRAWYARNHSPQLAGAVLGDRALSG
jgi:hypothetical protein